MSSAADISQYAHGRVPRAVRERQVLELAGDLFTERGYAGASMDELAARAGVSKPVIYDLVGSKEQLFRLVVQAAANELAESVATAVLAEREPADQLRAGALAFFRFVARHRPEFMMLQEGGAFAAEAAKLRSRQDALVSALITQTAPRTPPDPLQVEATAQALNGACEALANWWAGHPELPPEQLTEWFTDLALPGLEALRDRLAEAP